MHPIKLALIASGALFALTACTDGIGMPDWDLDSADTGYWDEVVPMIAEVSFTCDYGNPDLWRFYSYLDGWAGQSMLDIFETGDGNWPNNPSAVWSETHVMTNTNYADDGTWDEWSLTLRAVSSIGQQVGGQTTLFGCNWNDGGSLAFRQTIYDDNGAELDCVIWGSRSQQYFNGYLGDSCVCIDPDGRCDN